MAVDEQNEAQQRKALHEANTYGHLKMGLGYMGPRRPDEEEEGGSGGGPGLMAHPMLADFPEGAADPGVSANNNVNMDTEKELDRRGDELNLQLKNDLTNSHTNRATATATSAPTLKRG